MKELIQFLNKSTSVFHAVKNICDILEENNFTRLFEQEQFNLEKGGSYYVVRNDSSVVAFKIGKNLDNYKFNMILSHSDSPCFKLKPNPMLKEANYSKLNVEPYGGPIYATFMDRALSVSGRVIVNDGANVVSKLLDIDQDLLVIPNMAIHMNREVNSNMSLNPQIDMCPVYSTNPSDDIKTKLAEELNVETSQIVGFDLFLYNRDKAKVLGLHQDMFCSPKIDNLESAFTSVQALLNSNNEDTVSLVGVFDNEEVGSRSLQGADSNLLSSVVTRINNSLSRSTEEMYQALAKSFVVSCDNGHAKHPNQPGKSDAVNFPVMNNGIVIKSNSNLSYTSDGLTQGLFVSILTNAKVPYQFFTNRSDVRGGGTLGNISISQVSIPTVDIGLAQLAMHSSNETGGLKDVEYMINGLTAVLNNKICKSREGYKL